MPAKSEKDKIKKQMEALRKKLGYAPKLAWDVMNRAQQKEALDFGDKYKKFLDRAKTEREAMEEIVAMAKGAGFKDLSRVKSARKIYTVFRHKTGVLYAAGKKPPTEGLRLIGVHIDAPRLDLKGRPLIENTDLVFLKTHYYGGVRKYHWLARPLALHGVVVLKDGRKVKLAVGEDDSDPVLTITDLLPHLARKVQGEKKLSEAFEGEKLNLLIGGLPLGDDEIKERFKLHALKLLYDRYGITEADLITAELEAVPAGKARDVGLDASMIGAYGQDDRISAYCALAAVFEAKRLTRPVMVLFSDKEEIGSEGATGAKSQFLQRTVADVLAVGGITPSYDNVTRTLINTRCLSADVDGALDPEYPEVHEKHNAARMGYGVCLTKYTGHGGKYGASDADAEFLGWLRGVFDRAGVVWQPAKMGKVDEGGGGTIAKFMAELGMEVVDCGPPLLGMHSPFEVVHKADLFQTYRACLAFLSAP